MTSIAAIFPGQGSQKTGMLADLAIEWPQVRTTFDEASGILGYDLWQVVRENPDDRLHQTRTTQPAMLAADVAVMRVWSMAGGPAPAFTAGHSLGEYAALVQAGALSFADAVRVVAERARLMQNAVPEGEGAMAAVLGLDDERIEDICEHLPSERIVEPVNYNAPGQVVIAGHSDAVALALEHAREAGAKRAVELPVSVPAHSSLMKEAATALGDVLAEVTWTEPTIPVIHNVDASTHETDVAIRAALQRQLYNPVRWTATVDALRRAGATTLLEPGPGKVLTGLMRRIDRKQAALAVEDPKSLERALAHCTENEQ